jgi:hypothetical protein
MEKFLAVIGAGVGVVVLVGLLYATVSDMRAEMGKRVGLVVALVLLALFFLAGGDGLASFSNTRR